MFGYVMCNRGELSKEEQARYQSVYCGLCKALEKRYGQLSRLSLNYEMTFLILLLSSLYEPAEMRRTFKCALHPLKNKTELTNKFTDYAADMTIALTYHKCLDDWNDEKKHLQHLYSTHLKKAYDEVCVRYPRQCKAIEDGMEELTRIENTKGATADSAVNSFGKIVAEIFVCEEDFWSGDLRAFGYDLERFIYLMDATMDYKKDIKTGNYNPLVLMNKRPEEMEEVLKVMIGGAAARFEDLPLVQDGNLMRNILYGGVWQQYYARKSKKEKKHD